MILGGEITVKGAVGLAEAWRVSETLIGLTLVAVGTSLPEFATSAVAAWKGQSDIAVGNVVGSNLFNLLFILGVTATIRPVPVPAGGLIDLAMMCGLSLILLPLALSGRHRIVRKEGGLLLGAYVVYIVWRVAGVGPS